MQRCNRLCLFRVFCLLLILTGCGKINILKLKYRLYYTEKSEITNDTVFTLYQRVIYDKPNVIDEEFSYNLTLTFIDTAAAKAKKTLNLITDSSIVKAGYDIFSIWNLEDERNRLTGGIKILNWNSNAITLKENITVYDRRRNEIRRYSGTRTFKRGKN